MNKQPELHTTNLLMQPLSISFENAALQILRFSKIHENTHAWVIPLHTHPTIELHYILSGAGQIQIDDTLFRVETNDIYVTLPFVPHCQISSEADIMEEYCVECTLELPPAMKGEIDPLASLRRFLSRQAFSSAGAPDELLPLLQQLDQQAASSDPQLLQTKLLYLRCLFDFLGVLSEARLPDTLSGKKRADTTALRIKSYLDVNFRTPFSVQDLCVRSSIFDEMDLSIYTIPTGQSIRINGSVVNNSPYVFSGDLTVKTEASITRVRDGVRVWKDSSTTNYLDQCSAYSHTDFSFSSSSLPEGGYELTVCVSADGLEEAYTVNNTRSIAFTVTAAAPDTSGASVSIDIPEFDGDEGGVGTLTYTGVDSLYPAGTKLTWSVYEKYTSVLAKNWVLAYQGYDMPDSVRYLGSGKTVQTCVVLRPVDPALACVTLNAGSQTLLYYDLFALEADDNTDKCSSIPYGQKSLAAGEQFSFYISNNTTCVPFIKATPAVYAIRESDHARIDLWRGDPVSMAYGKSTEKTPHRVTSWDAELLPGYYTIYGEATYEYGSKTVLLSTLQVNADKPFVSIGRTFRGSKCCAVVLDCQAPAGDVVLGIEYREEGQEEVQFVSDSLSFASYSVSETRCLSFDTDLTTNYSFRTVCKQNGETFYGEWMECPEPSARQALTQTPQSGSAGDTVWEYTAEADGVYVLTVKANADVIRYDSLQKKGNKFSAPNTGRSGFFLRKGETALFLIQTQDAYTAAVLPPDAMELCKTAFFTTEYVGSEYVLQFTAPAAGTYTLHTEGPWGWIYQLCEDGTWLLSWHFSSDRPGNFSFTLKKGQTACFRFTNMKAGDFAITVSRPDPEVSVSDDGVHVSYDPECTGLHLIALYDTDGQLIDIRSVSVRSLEEHISAVLQGTRTGYVRVFQLDTEKHTPRTAAKQAELA